MNNLIKWFVTSSANPEEVALTVKGILLQYVAVALVFAQLAHIPLTENMLVDWVSTSTAILGTVLGVFGMLRKLYFLLKSPEN